MGASLRPETMRRITDAQEPAFVDSDTSIRQDIEIIIGLIKSGDPNLIRKSIRRLIKVCYGFELNESDLLLLAARKSLYLEEAARMK